MPGIYALIAQTKEQFRPKEKVEGLNPSESTVASYKGFSISGFDPLDAGSSPTATTNGSVA